ncbi:MAG: hypothetical protein FWC54_06235 [Actinomycetia bacterium]|nr:hypothetical protein [Actinomycetes bacterium]
MAEDLMGKLGGLADSLKGLSLDYDGDGKVELDDLQALAKKAASGANDKAVDTKADVEELVGKLTKFADKDGDGKPDVGPLLDQAKGLLADFGDSAKGGIAGLGDKIKSIL